MMIRLLVFLGFLSALTACKENLEAPEIIYKVPPEFSVDLFQARDAGLGGATFGLWVESMAPYDYANYGILSQVNVDDQQNIYVKILGPETPVTGLGAPDKARAFIPIKNFADGIYAFTLALGNALENKGTLVVKNGNYSLSMPGLQGFVLQNPELQAIAKPLIWGYVENPSELTKDAAEACIRDLKGLSADHGLTPGFYSYFTITGAGNSFLHTSIESDVPAILFIRSFNNDTAALRNVLNLYRDPQNQQPLKVHCFSTFGAF
ncbi:MAG: hypothetical protein NW218_08555 [Saprospiraceae bacterium]|nr:hypothetical protein [Saprospiraceae bacterium]